MSLMGREAEAFEFRGMVGLDARAGGVLCGPGGGKTRTLVALADAAPPSMGVLVVDPAGEAASLLGARRDFDVLKVPSDWRERPGLVPWVVRRLREKARVVVHIPPGSYKDAAEVAEVLTRACIEEELSDVLYLFEECQRYVPQNQGPGYAWSVQALVEMGRNWRCGRWFFTQRPASMSKEILARCDTLLLGRIQHPRDVDAFDEALELNIRDRRQRGETLSAMLDLAPGHFLLREPKNPPTTNRGVKRSG